MKNNPLIILITSLILVLSSFSVFNHVAVGSTSSGSISAGGQAGEVVIFSTSFEEVGVPHGMATSVGENCTTNPDASDISPPTGGGSEMTKFNVANPGFEADIYYTMPNTHKRIGVDFRILVLYEDLIDGEARIVHRQGDASANSSIMIFLYQTGGNRYLRFRLYNDGGLEYTDFGPITNGIWYRSITTYDTVSEIYDWTVGTGDATPTSQVSGSLTGTYYDDIKITGYGLLSNTPSRVVIVYVDLINIIVP